MEHRARTRLTLRHAGLLTVLSAALVPAVAGTAPAHAAKKPRPPVVTSIAPERPHVGEVLTIRGRHFRPGVDKNTVAFKRPGAKVLFVKAEKGTRKLLRVTLPERLESILAVENGAPVATRLRIRVLARRFGKAFTPAGRSPLVQPERPPAPPAPPAADPGADCDGDGQANAADADDDNDLLADDLEARLKLDGCKSDTDGDGVEDGYEYASARDLNDDEHQDPNTFLPYPGKRPYPNPLDATDADVDHDGDALDLLQEYKLWRYTGARTLDRLTYSAGEQYSVAERASGTGRRTPTLAAAGYPKQADFLTWAAAAGYAQVSVADVDAEWYDASRRSLYDIRDADRDHAVSADEQHYYDFASHQRNGVLSDSERDEDADGLSNRAETSGCMNPDYWAGLYDKESVYPVRYPSTALDDADSDGDGVRDGADDQDHDDLPNVMECNRLLTTGFPEDPKAAAVPQAGLPADGFVNPFNPCLPATGSRTCRRIVSMSEPWAPFNPDDIYYFVRD